MNLELNPVVFVSDEFDWAMASIDGLSNDYQIAVEIKCGEKSYYQAKKGMIPSYYNCQMQHQMKVCNLNKIFYFCYFNGDGIIMEVYRDDVFINKMLFKEMYYFDCLINLREPSLEFLLKEAL